MSQPISTLHATMRLPDLGGENLLDPRQVGAEVLDVLAELVGPSDTIASPEPWSELGICAQTDPDVFFPEKGGSTREAKRVCAGCSVRAECLEYALANDERFGIWGGLSERERRRIRRGRQGSPS